VEKVVNLKNVGADKFSKTMASITVLSMKTPRITNNDILQFYTKMSLRVATLSDDIEQNDTQYNIHSEYH
jgi:hypothetical protein